MNVRRSTVANVIDKIKTYLYHAVRTALLFDLEVLVQMLHILCKVLFQKVFKLVTHQDTPDTDAPCVPLM